LKDPDQQIERRREFAQSKRLNNDVEVI
jgi:hypothetical protein